MTCRPIAGPAPPMVSEVARTDLLIRRQFPYVSRLVSV